MNQSEKIFDLESIDVLDNDVSLGPLYRQFAGLIDKHDASQEERYARAVRAWAYTARARAFDNIARSIFKTQIAALRKLAAQPSDRRSLRPHYVEHQQRALAIGIPEADIPNLDGWIELNRPEIAGGSNS